MTKCDVCDRPATYRQGFPTPAWCDAHGPYAETPKQPDLVEQIREQLYIGNRIALAILRAPEMTATARAELAASIENDLRQS
jgi:hypothetical protein